jgi:hypothetical protein
MVGWSRRNRRSEPSTPCPCNNTCLCHKPQKESLFVWVLCFVGFGMLIGFPFLMGYVHHNDVRHINVYGQDCIVERKVDGVSGTGAQYGHDVAVCPSK